MSQSNPVNENEVLELASLAGHILLENGAEISRVEEAMERISGYYNVDTRSFFVLSNGIFTTGRSGYAKVEFIPFKGAQLFRVAAVSQICRDIRDGRYTIPQAREKLRRVREMKTYGPLMQVLGSAVGSAGFCVIFGGSLMDSAAAFMAGMLLWMFVVLVSAPHLSKIFGNIFGSALAALLCIAFHKAGFGEHLGNMIIGSVIPLIPGIPFTNGIRDIANEDYLAGATRLLDALMVFFSIAIGVTVAFLADLWAEGSLIALDGAIQDGMTASPAFQLPAAFIGTAGFAVLFGVPLKHCLPSAAVGTVGWLTYLLMNSLTGLGAVISTFCASAVVVILSRWSAVLFRTPTTIFIITGIFPMVPGGGLFWTTYFVVSSCFDRALSTGFLAVKVTIAIVLAIVLVTEIPSAVFHPHGLGRRSDA